MVPTHSLPHRVLSLREEGSLWIPLCHTPEPEEDVLHLSICLVNIDVPCGSGCGLFNRLKAHCSS